MFFIVGGKGAGRVDGDLIRLGTCTVCIFDFPDAWPDLCIFSLLVAEIALKPGRNTIIQTKGDVVGVGGRGRDAAAARGILLGYECGG